MTIGKIWTAGRKYYSSDGKARYPKQGVDEMIRIARSGNKVTVEEREELVTALRTILWFSPGFQNKSDELRMKREILRGISTLAQFEQLPPRQRGLFFKYMEDESTIGFKYGKQIGITASATKGPVLPEALEQARALVKTTHAKLLARGLVNARPVFSEVALVPVQRNGELYGYKLEAYFPRRGPFGHYTMHALVGRKGEVYSKPEVDFSDDS